MTGETEQQDPWARIHAAYTELHSEAAALLRARQAAGVQEHIHAFIEIERRTRMLGFGLRQIEQADAAWQQAAIQDVFGTLAGNGGNVGASFDAAFSLEYLCDAFYVCAFRIIDLAKVSGLFNLKAIGVRNVRNLFVIHPDKHKGVIEYSFGAGGGRIGPVYKPAQRPEQAANFTDEGLFANALVFADQLTHQLKAFSRS